MKRHERLIPLTHDHHHALAQTRRLRVAAKADDKSRLEATETFLDFFREDTLAHFREEEEKIFPLVVEHEQSRATLEQAMFEHLQIHSFVRTLKRGLDEGVVRREEITQLADALESHIRFEEKVVFPLIEVVASEALRGLALRSS